MVWPCLYTALTTIIGFGSLVFSGIKPVIDFGWMMSIGLAVAFVTAFTLFPAIVLLLGRTGAPERADAENTFTRRVTLGLALAAERHGAWVLAVAGALLVICALGVSRLTVENSFVDYFSEDTEIYRGLALIDRELGGTTPLEVVLDLDEDRIFDDEPAPKPAEYDAEAEREKSGYWFTEFKIERIKEVHDWLASQPEVGKVLSLVSLIRVGEKLNDGKPLDSLQLALVYRRVPEDLKRSLIAPYIDILWDEARISLRIRDTLPDLHRKELLDRIRAGLRDELELGPDDVTVSGLLVLYNNMLQSLFTSQISTLGAVLVGVALMLMLLFRSLTLAVLGIVPNLLAAGAVLGAMGLLSIPLDFMTITVAAVTIGIAVDNAIHYIYRFREEFARSGDYAATMHVCHANIGRAVFYTSATIIFASPSWCSRISCPPSTSAAHGACDGNRAACGAHPAAEAHPPHETVRHELKSAGARSRRRNLPAHRTLRQPTLTSHAQGFVAATVLGGVRSARTAARAKHRQRFVTSRQHR